MVRPQLSHLLRLLLAFTLFFIPLIGPQFNLGYEGAKVLVFYILSIISGILWILYSFLYPKDLNLKQSAILIWSTIFLAVLFISSLVGVDFHSSFYGNFPYYQGFLVYGFLVLFYLQVRSLKINPNFFVPAILFSSFLVSVFALKDWITLTLFNQYVPTYAGRVVSSFGQPNFYAGFLLLTLPFQLSQVSSGSKKIRILNLVGLTLSILAIIASQSRASIFLMIGFFLYAFAHRVTHKVKIILGLTVILFFLLFSSIGPTELINKEFIQPNSLEWLNKNSPEKRTLFWPIIGQVILDRPLLGFGLENLELAYSSYFEKRDNFSAKDLTLKNLVINRAHNYILDLLVFSGILGLITWGGVVERSLKKSNGVVLQALVLYLIWIQIQNQSVVHLLYFWLLIGLVDAHPKEVTN